MTASTKSSPGPNRSFRELLYKLYCWIQYCYANPLAWAGTVLAVGIVTLGPCVLLGLWLWVRDSTGWTEVMAVEHVAVQVPPGVHMAHVLQVPLWYKGHTVTSEDPVGRLSWTKGIVTVVILAG